MASFSVARVHAKVLRAHVIIPSHRRNRRRAGADRHNDRRGSAYSEYGNSRPQCGRNTVAQGFPLCPDERKKDSLTRPAPKKKPMRSEETMNPEAPKSCARAVAKYSSMPLQASGYSHPLGLKESL